MPGPMFQPPEYCLKKLKVGTKVRERQSGIVFLIAEHDHEDWKGITSLITDCVIKNAAYDAAEPDSVNKYIREFGNSDYSVSNIHQWLNADRDDWYHPAHFKDMPPEGDLVDRTPEFYYQSPDYPENNKLWGPFDYRKEPGFLMRFSPRFRNAIKPVRLPISVTKETGLMEKGYLFTGVFLPSMREVGYDEYDPDEIGSRFALFENPIYRICAPTPEAVGQDADYRYKDVLWWFMTRNSAPELPGYIYKITPGYRGGMFASRQAMLHRCNVASGVRPVINVNSFFPVSKEPDENGVYDLMDTPESLMLGGHNMMTIPADLTQTLSINGRVDEKLTAGCTCDNIHCIRHGLCEPCEYYHSSAYGTVNLFRPTCKQNHFMTNPEIMEMTHDDLGRTVLSYAEAEKIWKEKHQKEE